MPSRSILVTLLKAENLLIIIFVLFIKEKNVFSQIISPHYYKYQISDEIGIGNTLAPVIDFPFSSSLGASIRYKQHQLCYAEDYYTRIEIFQTATDYSFINAYYGILILSDKNYNIQPQLGIGSFETNNNSGKYYV